MNKQSSTILIVDDDESMRDTLEAILKKDFNVAKVSDGKSAISTIKKKDIDVVLLDIRLPDINGIDVLKEIKEDNEDVDVIMITAVREIDTAVKAIKLGAYDYIKSLADIIAWSVYSDENGIIQFRDRKPYVMGSDTSSLTIDNDGTLSITRSVSDVDLRNRVVVYGGPNGVYAEASVASPYLPAGYFKSVVVATEVLDRQNYAQLAADYNLEKLNRLTTSLSMELVGNSNVACRDVITIQNTELSINSDWYVYSLEHNWGRDGYRMNAELRQ